MEISMEFNQELALALYESMEEFPVCLDQAYIWLGYTRKDSAKDKIINMFEEGVDYIYVRALPEPDNHGTFSPQELAAKAKKEIIYLSVPCLKELGMVVGTSKGKQIRKYFLECEKIAKRVTETVNPILLEALTSMQKEMKLLSERTQKLDIMEKATSNNRGIKGVIDTEVLELYPETLFYTVKEYLQMKGVDERHLHTMRKRAVMFANQGKQINLPRKGNEYVFRGNDISYLDQALKTVLGLD